MTLIQQIETLLVNYLNPYLSSINNYSVSSNANLIEIQGKKRDEDKSFFILLRLGINESNGEIYIHNIYLPIEDRKKRIGLSLIAFIYKISKTINFGLILADMTDSFREVMLKRGAIKTNVYDCLQIVDTTKLI
jgi:hypothetical protein